MIIDIYKEVNGEPSLIATLKKDISDIRQIQAGLGSFIEEALGEAVKVECGTRKFYENREGYSTMTAADANVSYCGCSSEIGRLRGPESPWQAFTVVDGNGNSVTENFGLEFKREGYVLAIGKEVSTIFGCGVSDGYLAKITRTQVHYGRKSGAKLFATKTDLLKFVEKYERVLKEMVSRNGWELSCEPASERFLEEEILTYMNANPKQKEKYDSVNAKVEVKLAAINSEGDVVIPYEPKETPKEEALARMKSLDLWDRVIEDYRNEDKIYQSVEGVIYDLDEDAKAGVEYTKQYGLPYHVVAGRVAGRTVYSVLYVSQSTESWEDEQYDRRNNIIFTSTWMPDFADADFGDIGVIPVSGGLRRIA